MSFSKDFYWGAASSSYQIEGAAFRYGKGLSIWDTFCQINGKIKNGESGEVACDHYHRFREDVALMKELGLKAYRFSISWPRILPDGTGKVNEEGIKFYSDLVDELLKAGIEPFITLFHWDLPKAVYDRGGWRNREIADWFAEYTKVVVDALSDKVRFWITLNEALCHILLGHNLGVHAPGETAPNREIFRMLHHINLAHGKAVHVIRKFSKTPAVVGFAPNPGPGIPLTDRIEDIEAAKAYTFSGTVKGLFSNGWWMDPILTGEYPKDGIEAMAKDFPSDMIKEGDMELIGQKLDFLGVNLYQGAFITHDESGSFKICPQKPGYPINALKWQITPQILYYMPKFLYEKYQLPILITENGIYLPDWISLDGKVHDANRIDFMHRYLKELKKASDEGIDIMGYFAWSIMDNFEWSEGYNERFGLIYIDYETQKRIPKDSYYWYKDVISLNGDNL